MTKPYVYLFLCLLFSLISFYRVNCQYNAARDSLSEVMISLEKTLIDSNLIKRIAIARELLTKKPADKGLPEKLVMLEMSLIYNTKVDKSMITDFFELTVRCLKYSVNYNWDMTVSSMGNLATLYQQNGLYNKAFSLYPQVLDSIKSHNGENDFDYIIILSNLAALYTDLGLYKKADSAYRNLLEIKKKRIGEHHVDYAKLSISLGKLYGLLGRYDEAFYILEAAGKVVKDSLGEKNPVYAIYLNNLGYLYMYTSQYDKSLPCFEDALNIIRRKYGETHPDYARFLNNQAVLYENMGLYNKALELKEKAAQLAKKSLGEDQPEYAVFLNNLAGLHKLMGSYTKAIFLYQKCLNILEKTAFRNHPNYLNVKGNLGLLYVGLGLYDKAFNIYKEVIEGKRNTLGEEHPDYAKSIMTFAGLYEAKGMYNKSLELYQKALPLLEKSLGIQHPDYATDLNNIGDMYKYIGEYKKAETYINQSLAIKEKAIGTDHAEYLESINSLASLYAKTRRHAKSDSLYQQSMTSLQRIWGTQHDMYAQTLSEAASNCIQLNKMKNALEYASKANQIWLKNITVNISTLSEQEKLTIMASRSSRFDFLPSVIFFAKTAGKFLPQQLYNNELLLKGMVLQDQEDILRSMRKSQDSADFKLYEHWKFYKQMLGRQMLLPLSKRVKYLDSLQNLVTIAEEQLSIHSAAFRAQQQNTLINTTAIAKKLKSGEAAIEFVRFKLFNEKWTDRIMYAALILLPADSNAHFVPLFEEKKIERVLRTASGINTSVYKLYPETGNTQLPKAGSALYRLIWKPLEKYLSNINTVYYAPTGLLHSIAFQAIQHDRGHLLIDKYRLMQLISTRSVAQDYKPAIKPMSARVWGDVDYNLMSSSGNADIVANRPAPARASDTSSSFFNLYACDVRGAQRGGAWAPLPGTRYEISNIRKIFTGAGITVNTLTGKIATEEEFKALDGKSPQILHLATHGFFLPVREVQTAQRLKTQKAYNMFTVQQNAMFRSGLILAGGNYSWMGNAALPGKEDGILTAYEISQLDLSSTELVVMSACETALGDLHGSEGVIGLQRAFKMAGVKQLIVSLWRVPDKETIELMSMFYKNLLGGQATREALRNAQLKMKEKYLPYYWAGFVLVE